MGACKLAVGFDSRGEVHAVTFRAFDGAKVWHGSFGLAEHQRTEGMQAKKKWDMREREATNRLAETVFGVLREFCT